MPKNVVCKKCNNLVNDWREKVIKYTCGAGTPEEAETNCTHFIRGECTASFCEYRRKKQTNADRFRAMSNEEQQNCIRKFWEIEDFADWLQQPAE